MIIILVIIYFISYTPVQKIVTLYDICVYVCNCVIIYMYIYIYRERERERHIMNLFVL